MESIRCCIACIFPCGALDVVRVVHANGRVEELGGRVLAGELMRAHPRHVVRRPSSAYDDDCDQSTATTLPPDAELKRGKIYFLIPTSAVEKPPPSSSEEEEEEAANSKTRRRRTRTRKEVTEKSNDKMRRLRNSERCSSEIRRGSRVGVWRPHLESISENGL
ncbi:uncharacterized protein [Typha angustifolia]|uniref:uncharacterized protein n=1 Tax=Typha angustifolia TaxID=59011 RepID=UPI003C2F55CD